jgi:UDP-N-acetylglucosamine 2-epimerase (non-hydrolysing)
LVGTDKETIIHEVSVLINNPIIYDKMTEANNPYGDGKACGRITKYI